MTVGHILGATALGYYVLAWNLASWPVNMFSQPVRNVAPALFSRLQHDPPAMRTGFASATALLGVVTLPICLLISGSAVPLVSFVYGPKWVPAAQALFWLALLAALRIFFELSYDYFVVLARSRVVFTVQLAWLLALIPLLIGGAKLYGIGGVALAGVLAAAFLVLPWYLVELGKVGIKARSLAGRLWLSLVVAAGVGAAAWAAAQVIPSAFWACAAGGTIALGAIGLLGFKMRPVLAELRPALAARKDPTAGTAAEGLVLADPTAEVRRGDPADQVAGLKALLALAVSAPRSSDMSRSLPMNQEPDTIVYMYHNVLPNPSARASAEPLAGSGGNDPPRTGAVSGDSDGPEQQAYGSSRLAAGSEVFASDWPGRHERR